ncbi:Alpha/Beta_hydrolase fold [Hexamita inflata]|uniref:Alpha/Beta hydrolase fold n=1 Tax=Hexamita inflata TaxID=28002 RepID=A0AA86QHB4_9EUKA|nr:Alpha/Beta hydrolase fold [Hexamita inflata]
MNDFWNIQTAPIVQQDFYLKQSKFCVFIYLAKSDLKALKTITLTSQKGQQDVTLIINNDFYPNIPLSESLTSGETIFVCNFVNSKCALMSQYSYQISATTKQNMLKPDMMQTQIEAQDDIREQHRIPEISESLKLELDRHVILFQELVDRKLCIFEQIGDLYFNQPLFIFIPDFSSSSDEQHIQLDLTQSSYTYQLKRCRINCMCAFISSPTPLQTKQLINYSRHYFQTSSNRISIIGKSSGGSLALSLQNLLQDRFVGVNSSQSLPSSAILHHLNAKTIFQAGENDQNAIQCVKSAQKAVHLDAIFNNLELFCFVHSKCGDIVKDFGEKTNVYQNLLVKGQKIAGEIQLRYCTHPALYFLGLVKKQARQFALQCGIFDQDEIFCYNVYVKGRTQAVIFYEQENNIRVKIIDPTGIENMKIMFRHNEKTEIHVNNKYFIGYPQEDVIGEQSQMYHLDVNSHYKYAIDISEML